MRTRITLAVLVTVLVVGALVVSPLFAVAQTAGEPTRPAQAGTAPEPVEPVPGARQERAESFLATFADELGVSTEEVDAAFDTAVTEQLDTAVADGDLSRERADRIAERLADRDLADLFRGPGGGDGHGWGPRFGGPSGGAGRGFGGTVEQDGDEDGERAG